MSKGDSGLFSNTVGSKSGKQLEIDTRTLNDNLPAVEKEYFLSKSGHFGEKGKNVRVIKSRNPVSTSQDFYSKIGEGGSITALPNGKGTMTTLSDGTRIVHRLITSTKGSPAVEITINSPSKVKNQKIHFIREEK